MSLSRPIQLLLVLAAASLCLGACQTDSRGADKDSLYGDLEELDPGGALVVYWHALTGADEHRLLEMIDDFNADNEWNITVVGEYQGDLGTIHDKVIAGLPTDQLPSIVMSAPGLAAAYAVQDVAVPLSRYLGSRNWGFSQAERDDFFPSALTLDGLPQFGDQLYSFSSCRSLQVLYYNLDWLKELGYDAPPETWDEFREMACAASIPADGLFGFELGMDSSIFNSLLVTQGLSLVNRGGTAYILGGEQGRAALQFLQDLIDDGCAQWETEQGHRSDFGAGRVLFVIDSTDELVTYQRTVAEQANFTWALSDLPHTTEEPLVGVEGISSTILRTIPEEQLAAWLFIKWLAEPEQQARWAQQVGCFPTRRSAFEEMEIYLRERPAYGLAPQLLEQKWITEPGVTAYATCSAAIGRMLYAVTAGESVDQWLADTLSSCNQALSDALE
jgi:multiple sugar transport system substrate-binding protein